MAAPASVEGQGSRYGFEDLKRSYNFRHPSDRVGLFRGLIAEEAARHTRPVRAIDIGCGQGIGLDTQASRDVRQTVDELWGVEPDKTITPGEGIFTNFQHATIETADLPADYFDLAYSSLVMEHVQEPAAFFRAVYRALKPGGTHLFLTINGRHYFARITSLLKTLHLDETVLRLVRGRQEVSEYHYPVAYRCNKPRDIERVCRETGFEAPEFVFVEREGPAPYFPGPFKAILAALNYKRKVIQKPEALLEVIVRVRKPMSAGR
jgi:2-polyprenyl-3-methyl-5-hydroxy-6-metoxy-1,4-benzoquinol methylase